jgi:hypothetical protein
MQNRVGQPCQAAQGRGIVEIADDGLDAGPAQHIGACRIAGERNHSPAATQERRHAHADIAAAHDQ